MITRARAMEMMLLGEKIPAKTALEWGLINRCVPDAELLPTAKALAAELANGPTKTLAAIRHLAWASLDNSWSEQVHAERMAQNLAMLRFGGAVVSRRPDLQTAHQLVVEVADDQGSGHDRQIALIATLSSPTGRSELEACDASNGPSCNVAPEKCLEAVDLRSDTAPKALDYGRGQRPRLGGAPPERAVEEELDSHESARMRALSEPTAASPAGVPPAAVAALPIPRWPIRAGSASGSHCDNREGSDIDC